MIVTFVTKVNLCDAMGHVVANVTGTTDAKGVATLWVKLDSNMTPFKVQLSATAQVGGQITAPVESNPFSVLDPSTGRP